ncbi:MAG: type I glutamate--ammonia ligase [Promethearchaeota archaeon]
MYNQENRQKISQILTEIQEKEIKFCLFQFLSIDGRPKSIGINTDHLEDLFYNGEGFDGSSITGYGRLEESDMVAVPDPQTFAVIPWREEGEVDARLICDIYKPNGERFPGDPRYILQKTIKEAADMGYKFYLAPELEFFLLKQGNHLETPQPIDFRGYFGADDSELDHLIRRKIAVFAEKFPGINVETVHHEVARSQNEISMKYDNALKMADSTMTMKMVVKVVAAQHNMLATFMPKPWAGQNGSGMHVHQSLWNITTKQNVFFNAEDPNQISETLRYFIAGQLKHAHSMTAILNSWPNSYKRLVPGYEAPTLIAWGFKNRSMLIRVPNFFNKANAARCEIRSPDPAGNPYLQFAALLNAGLDGIKYKIEPPEAIDINLFHLTQEELRNMGIENIPTSLDEALRHMERSSFTRELLGEDAYRAYSDLKWKEYNLYRNQVTEWELKRYSQVL